MFFFSVFFCEKKNIGDVWGEFFSLMLGRLFSHRTHRSNRTFLAHVSNSQKASGIQSSQSVTAKGGCKVL